MAFYRGPRRVLLGLHVCVTASEEHILVYCTSVIHFWSGLVWSRFFYYYYFYLACIAPAALAASDTFFSSSVAFFSAAASCSITFMSSCDFCSEEDTREEK